ncbi:MAG: hypothetical protein F9K25_14155 [Candidatus Contendobacter sp.]|nr:MAG: hypothetical protein F9K25_14155 [Candidatus Contendobacter sp.]
MKVTGKLITSALFVIVLTLHGCAPPPGQSGMESGMETFGRGMAGLVLSPLMIIAGLAQGLAFLPYTVGASLDELNRGLVQAQAVSLNESYKATYHMPINDPRVDQQTGQIAGQNYGFGQHRPEAMLEATQAFQRLLISQGMPPDKAKHYALVGDYTYTRTRGQILVAVVYRHTGMEPFRVVSKETGIVTTFRPENQGWRTAYERDVNGRVIDEVIDWAGFDYAILRQNKVVAMLMVIAAESVKSGKRSPDYWPVERRWAAGETNQIIAESANRVERAIRAH